MENTDLTCLKQSLVPCSSRIVRRFVGCGSLLPLVPRKDRQS